MSAFYADKLVAIGNFKDSSVFNFVILLKSRKFDAREIYVFYSIRMIRKKKDLSSACFHHICIITVWLIKQITYNSCFINKNSNDQS